MEQRGHLAVSLVVTVWRPSMGTTAGLWEPEAGVHLCCCQAEVGKGGSGSSRIMEVMSPMCVCHTCFVFPATLLPSPPLLQSPDSTGTCSCVLGCTVTVGVFLSLLK